jgi:methyl-accepting chemotaxis protein
MSEEIVKKMMEEFVTSVRDFNNILVRLQETMNHVSQGQSEIASELRELRREFAALAAKIEMALSRR